MRVLDVGCGPGALAVELAGRVGEDNVAAIDPAPQFAAACQARIPGADVREGVAESLPWDDGTFDAAMCSLVVAWMSDADQGIGEMARVTKPGGTVAAAMWDIPGGGLQMLSHFWRAAREIDPSVADEQPRAGVREGDLVERFGRAGLQSVTGGTLETSVDYADFDDYWEPFTGAAGPATGAFYASLGDAGKATLRDTVRASLPEGPFASPILHYDGTAWATMPTPVTASGTRSAPIPGRARPAETCSTTLRPATTAWSRRSATT